MRRNDLRALGLLFLVSVLTSSARAQEGTEFDSGAWEIPSATCST